MGRGRDSGKSKGGMRGGVRKQAGDEAKGSGISYVTIPEGTEIFKPTKKNHELDVIPYEVSVKTHPYFSKGDLADKRAVYLHRGVGPSDETVVCLAKTFGIKCPICEERDELRKDYDDNKELVSALKPKARHLFNVVDLDEPKKGVQLFDASQHTFGKHLNLEIQEKEEYADYAEPKGGYTLKIRFVENTELDNPFFEVSRIDFEERDDLSDRDLNDAFDLDAILNVLDYNELSKLFMGEGGEETSDSDTPEDAPEDPPKRGGRSRERRGSGEDEDKGDEDSGSDSKCPEKFVFGKDCEKHKECDECPQETWDSCKTEQDRLEKEDTKGSGRRSRRS